MFDEVGEVDVAQQPVLRVDERHVGRVVFELPDVLLVNEPRFLVDFQLAVGCGVHLFAGQLARVNLTPRCGHQISTAVVEVDVGKEDVGRRCEGVVQFVGRYTLDIAYSGVVLLHFH